MKIETEDLTQKLSDTEEKFLTANIIEKYERFDEQRSLQLTDIKLVRDAIYNSDIPKVNGWDNRVELPDIYELAQTLKSHISQNLYSHPDAMFDVSGTTPQTQSYANRQKAMLVNTFEQMHIEDEIEQDDAGDDRSQVGVEDGREGVGVTVFQCGFHRFSCSQFFLGAFINQHVRVNGHAQ